MRGNTNRMVYEHSKDCEQTGHLPSLLKGFAVQRDLSLLVDLLQSLKQIFINVSYHILVASVASFKTEPSELDWLQVYDIKH